MPEVTVLMAVYNGERYLREAIESILSQTFQDFEFLIINDGSTDRTREIVLSYADPRIRLVDNEGNLGQTRSLNRGLERAQGQFIARQDADDISEPERLARQVAFLEANPELALVGTWATMIDAQGVPIGAEEFPCDCTQIRWCLLFFNPFVHGSVMLRKSAVPGQIGFYNEAITYAQDYELWSRIARSLPVANVGEHLVKLRITPWSMKATCGSRVDDEPLQISVANMCHLLAGNGTQSAARADIKDSPLYRKLATLRALYEADGTKPGEISTPEFASLLHALLTNFRRLYDISYPAWNDLVQWLSTHWLRLAWMYHREKPSLALWLWWLAMRHNHSLLSDPSARKLPLHAALRLGQWVTKKA